MRTNRPARRRAACALLIGLVLLAFSCGKKGPPVAPGAPRPPRVEALTADVQAQTVILRWTHPKGSDPVAGYGIYRAATDLAAGACADCPLLFQKQGEVQAAAGQTTFEFSDPVKPGFRYTYKVRPYLEDRGQGPFSDVVAVQIP